ncbi:ROK family transcriptional regulator [Vallitalea sediminicola]
MKGLSNRTLRPLYRRKVIKTLLQYGPISRTDVAAKLNISKATVSSISEELLKKNLIAESSIAKSTGGRKAILYDIKKNGGYLISLEITPTYISGTLLDLHANMISDSCSETNKEYAASFNIILETIYSLIKEMPKEQPLIGISINFRGTVSKDNVIKYFDYDSWRSMNLLDDLSKHFTCLINLNNEANARAYYNSVHLDNSDLTLITMGTGVGLGIVEDNQIYLGYHGYAGEIGHIIVEPDGIPCPCGNHGCLESYISTLEILKRLSTKKNKVITINDFKYLYSQNDIDVLEVVNDFYKYLAIATNNVINIFNPKYMILSSEIIDSIPNFIEIFKQKLNSKVSDYERLIIFSNNRSGAIGGAYLLLRDFFDIEFYIKNSNK